MKVLRPLSLGEIAALSGSQLIRGAPSALITGVAALDQAKEGDLSFFHRAFVPGASYQDSLRKTQASACFLSEKDMKNAPEQTALLVIQTPAEAFATVVETLCPPELPIPGIHPSAIVDPTAVVSENCCIEAFVVISRDATLGNGCWIGAHTVIGPNVTIGNGVIIGPHVTLTNADVGHNVRIKAGARIGQRGFGFIMTEHSLVDVPHLGRVIIGEYAEIGANTTIDRGTLGDTIIGAYTRIDNLVQIGHNVSVGQRCMLAGQVGIAGSSYIGNFCALGGQVGVSGHVKLADGTQVAAKSGVMRSSSPKEVLAGIPAVPIQQWRKNVVSSFKKKHEGEKS